MVLHERPGHRGGALGTQGDAPATLVVEVVHLLAHHVGALAHALEHRDVLEHRRLEQAVAGGLDLPRERVISPCQRPVSGGSTSRVPTGALRGAESDTASEATGAPRRPPNPFAPLRAPRPA